jgi:hypothetical protein
MFYIFLFVKILARVLHAAYVSWFCRIRSEVTNMLQLTSFRGGAGTRRLVTLPHVVGEADPKRHPGVQGLWSLLPVGGRLLALQLGLRLGAEEGGPGILQFSYK